MDYLINTDWFDCDCHLTKGLARNHEVLATERNHIMLTMILLHGSRSGVRCRKAAKLVVTPKGKRSAAKPREARRVFGCVGRLGASIIKLGNYNKIGVKCYIY